MLNAPLVKLFSLQIGIIKREKQFTIAAYIVPVITVPEIAIIQALNFLLIKLDYHSFTLSTQGYIKEI